ncbi:hypothetical protein ACJIZ3_002204 [Penstemon smallii]|uniref:Uncharacterized protein n=1 Tax=Penstemon smallii TaxID=265156 RepID=A0ABD3U7N0_9LAMI
MDMEMDQFLLKFLSSAAHPTHGDSLPSFHVLERMDSEDNLLYERNDSEYDGENIFQHLKFDFLNAYLNDNLAKYIVKRREKRQTVMTMLESCMPPQFLTTLHKLCMEKLKKEKERPGRNRRFFSLILIQTPERYVKEVVEEHVLGCDTKTQDDEFVSLGDDKDNMSYGTQSFKRSQDFTSNLSAEMVGQELFDVRCPIELKFDNCTVDFGPKELYEWSEPTLEEENEANGTGFIKQSVIGLKNGEAVELNLSSDGLICDIGNIVLKKEGMLVEICFFIDAEADFPHLHSIPQRFPLGGGIAFARSRLDDFFSGDPWKKRDG